MELIRFDAYEFVETELDQADWLKLTEMVQHPVGYTGILVIEGHKEQRDFKLTISMVGGPIMYWSKWAKGDPKIQVTRWPKL